MTELNLTPIELYIPVPVSEIDKTCFEVEYLDSFLKPVTAIVLTEEELMTFACSFAFWKDKNYFQLGNKSYVRKAEKFAPSEVFVISELLSIFKEELSKQNNNTPKEKEV